MRTGSDPGRLGAVVAAVAIFAAPFLALLYRTEAGLVVMAIALGAVSLVLHVGGCSGIWPMRVVPTGHGG